MFRRIFSRVNYGSETSTLMTSINACGRLLTSIQTKLGDNSVNIRSLDLKAISTDLDRALGQITDLNAKTTYLQKQFSQNVSAIRIINKSFLNNADVQAITSAIAVANIKEQSGKYKVGKTPLIKDMQGILDILRRAVSKTKNARANAAKKAAKEKSEKNENDRSKDRNIRSRQELSGVRQTVTQALENLKKVKNRVQTNNGSNKSWTLHANGMLRQKGGGAFEGRLPYKSNNNNSRL